MIFCHVSVLLTLLFAVNHCLTEIPPTTPDQDPTLRSDFEADDYEDVCQNGGTRIETSGSSILCNCVPGYFGPLCENDGCLNGGIPVPTWQAADGGFICICKQGFTGHRCGNCPAGFTLVTTGDGVKAGCYKALLTRADWPASVKTCNSLYPDAHLAYARTKEENDRLIKFMKSIDFKPCLYWDNVFIGGQRRRDGVCTDEFVWKYGGKPVENLTFTDWYPEQPSCTQYPGLTKESCLAIDVLYNYKWNDVACDAQACAVCEVSGF